MDQIAKRWIGAFFQQRRTVARGQDRIDDDRRFAYRRQREEGIADSVIAGEHSDLDRGRSDRVEGRAQLFEQDRGEDREHSLYSEPVLNRERSRNGSTMDAEGTKDLEVGLKAGTARRIGTRN